MPQIERTDPYKNFRFRVKFVNDGTYVLGVSKVSGLKRTTEVVEHRDGGHMATSFKLPGRTKYEAITLERGITQNKEFAKWANKVWSFQNAQGLSTTSTQGIESSLKDFRRDITIDVFDEGGGQPVLSYTVHQCWVSEYQALPELDANANAVAIENLKLECESWIQEQVTPPAPSQFDDPA
jgi:phage tail-like protein